MNPAALNIMFILISAQFNLPQGLLSSVCLVESGHNIKAVHRKDGAEDSLGLCQIKLKTAKYLGFKGTAEQLMVPETNILYAAKYLDHQYKKYGDIPKALVAYNRGNAKGLTRTTYSDKVMKQWRNIANVGYSTKKRSIESGFIFDSESRTRSCRQSIPGG